MRVRIALLVFMLVSLPACATASFGWSPSTEGCMDRGLFEVFEAPELADLSPMDVRVGRLDGQIDSPSVLVHFKRRFDGIGITSGPPQVLIAVGNFNKRTCAVLVEAADCPGLEAAYSAVTSTALPMNFRFEQPQTLTQMHGSTYYLLARDGLGNTTEWSYYGSPSHPMQAAIDGALASALSCGTEARRLYDEVL